MKIITTTQDLAAFCETAATHAFVTIDTEFLRERTYFAKLCLIQMAYPGDDPDSAVLIDTLSDNLDLAPLYALFGDETTVKVFHAARQDLEIFFFEGDIFPKPFFDTQVAAMVCGFGDQVGYETLVRKIARQPLDKSSRFTDWSQRPLTARQQDYALGDVTHLRDIYEFLLAKLKSTHRESWVAEELQALTHPETYVVEPDEAWRRVKTRSNSGKFLAVVRELAKFREQHARTRNIPRSRVYKDEALLEVAANKPKSLQELGKSRLLLREARRGDIADGILQAVRTGVACPADERPEPMARREKTIGNEALSDLLKVLLKAKSEASGVAGKLIATSADLDEIAAGARDVPALHGWRAEVFGNDAQRLADGQIALSANGRNVAIIDV